MDLDSVLNVDVLPDIFDYLNFIVAIVTVGISLLAIFRTIKESKTSFEIGIYTMIQEAKINMDNNVAEIPPEERKKRQLEINTYIENYLNALNMACAMYYTSAIKKKRFNTLYKDDIIRISQNAKCKNLISRNDDEFTHLKKYIEEQTK